MKNRILLFMAGCCALVLSSCLGSDSDVEYTVSRDCEITSFSLSSDSVRELENVVFTIDQIKGRIFNMDSLPYGTVLDRKVTCSMSFAGTVVECKIMQEATGDTVLWQDVDSLDFSKPVKMVTKLWDGQTTKGYLAQVNIHTVVPDSMEWDRFAEQVMEVPAVEQKVVTFAEDGASEQYYMFVEPKQPAHTAYALYCSPVADGRQWSRYEVEGLPAGQIDLSQITVFEDRLFAVSEEGILYTSSNGRSWKKVENTPVICSLLGALNTDDRMVSSSQVSALAVIAEKEGQKYFSCMTAKGKWLPENESEVYSVPDDFPVRGFANISYYAMYCARLSLIGGHMLDGGLSNKTWGTTDGLNWQNLTVNDKAVPFKGIEGASVVEYDNLRGEENKFIMIGGFDPFGKASSAIYRTSDGGVSWAESDTLVVMPDNFKARGNMSIHVDKDNYIYLFGGKEDKKLDVIDEIWRGRINRLGFDFIPLK